MKDLPEVQEAFDQTVELAKSQDGKVLSNTDEIIEMLEQWSKEDRKITPLKTLQGILWKEGYHSGEIRGHVYPDVPEALQQWKSQGIKAGVFSSGSVTAQKLLFGSSEKGDLLPYFGAFFDTNTGGKREEQTYTKISELLKIQPENILFLSDIREELEAAQTAGMQTIQLVRPGTEASWEHTAADFSEIRLK